MNIQSFGVVLAAGTLFFATASAHTSTITNLPTVQVHPTADQLAQLRHEAASDIPTLPGISVHPDAKQLRQIAAERAMAARIVTLATVEVRPSVEQRSESAARAGQAVATSAIQREPGAQGDGMASILHAAEAIIGLPAINLGPVRDDLNAVSAVAGKLR